MIERNCHQAQLFAKRLRSAGFQVLNDVVLNQVMVSFRRRRGDPAGDRCSAGGRNMLVRRHALARTGRYAHQRIQLGDHRSRRGAQRGGNDPSGRWSALKRV